MSQTKKTKLEALHKDGLVLPSLDRRFPLQAAAAAAAASSSSSSSQHAGIERVGPASGWESIERVVYMYE
eukprot:COSAG01_NODE_105_length_26080_cov_7.640237_8_plen_70_part_00